jgi:hypothetical protein
MDTNTVDKDKMALVQVQGGWAVKLGGSRELARFTGEGALRRAIYWVAAVAPRGGRPRLAMVTEVARELGGSS